MLALLFTLAAAPEAPVMTKKVFTQELKLPLTLAPETKREGPALPPKDAEKLLTQAIAVTRRFPHLIPAFENELAQTREALAGTAADSLIARLVPAGRVRVGACTLWLSTWTKGWPDTFVSVLVLLTSKDDGKMIDGTEIAHNGGGAGVGGSTGSAVLSPKGAIVATHEATRFENEEDVVLARARTGWTLGPDCKLTDVPPFDELITVRDAKSGEQLALTDDGKALSVTYRAKAGAPTHKLEVTKADRAAGTLTVRFSAKQEYPLAWDSARRVLSCTNPDGGVQRFERL